MTLENLYSLIGTYVRNGYGHLEVDVENSFGEGGQLNAIQVSRDRREIILKEFHGPSFFEGGLYDAGRGEPFIGKVATGEEGPGITRGDHVLERHDDDHLACTIAGIPGYARFTGDVVLFDELYTEGREWSHE